MKGSHLKYFILIPLGTIALLFIFDFAYRAYNQKIIDNDVKEVLEYLMYNNDLHTKQEYEEYAKEKFEEKKYTNLSDVNVVLDEDKTYLSNYREYFSVIHFLSEKKNKVHASYVGYLNEYKEAVIEKYEEELDENLE